MMFVGTNCPCRETTTRCHMIFNCIHRLAAIGSRDICKARTLWLITNMTRNSIPDFPGSVRVLLIHLKMSVQKAKKHSKCINFWTWQCGLQLKHLHIISFISPATECVNSEAANVVLRSVGRRTFQTRPHLKPASTALTLPEHFTWMFFFSHPPSLRHLSNGEADRLLS